MKKAFIIFQISYLLFPINGHSKHEHPIYENIFTNTCNNVARLKLFLVRGNRTDVEEYCDCAYEYSEHRGFSIKESKAACN